MSDENYTKVKYSNEGGKIKPVSWIICSLLFILSVLDTVFLHLSFVGVISKIPVIIIIVVILLVSKKFGAKQEGVRKRRNEFIQYGEQCEGKIVAVNKHRYYNTTLDQLSYYYTLSAEYYSEKSGCYKTVESDSLALTPNDIVGNGCIVYEYNGEAIIDSVSQLTDKKMSPLNVVILIITIALFGVAAWFFTK